MKIVKSNFYVGEDGSEELANEIAQEIAEEFEDVEVEITQGQQPGFPYLSVWNKEWE